MDIQNCVAVLPYGLVITVELLLFTGQAEVWGGTLSFRVTEAFRSMCNSFGFHGLLFNEIWPTVIQTAHLSSPVPQKPTGYLEHPQFYGSTA